jgi:tRNA-specific 2-thiouridylase
VRLLAALSGGVDSAVAARSPSRPVTTSPPSTSRCRAPRHAAHRLARLLLQGGRPRRRPGRRRARAPFYVWDLAERFREDVVDDFVAEYAAGRTPNPCLRCNEKIKFTAVLDRARASASTPS